MTAGRRVYLEPWRIDVTVRPTAAPLPRGVTPTGLARDIAAALEAGGAPHPASIGLTLSDDRELASLNARHLGEDGPTDVLSFPLLPPEAYPSHEGATRGQPAHPTAPQFALPPGRRQHLGDIVISVERATAQAIDGRGGQTGDVTWSAAEELRLLAIHGTLHVCGWDHAEASEAAAMRALEARLQDPARRS